MTERPGLYVMVFLGMLGSCSADNQATQANKELKRIADAVKQQSKAYGCTPEQADAATGECR